MRPFLFAMIVLSAVILLGGIVQAENGELSSSIKFKIRNGSVGA